MILEESSMTSITDGIFPTIFISHSSKDKRISDKIFEWLNNQGLSVWLDKYELFPGLNLKEELTENVRKADYMVLLISESSLMSKWVKFETDIAFANEREDMKMKIIPIVLGDVKIPRKLKERIYLKIKKLDSKCFEEILKAVFQDYYILNIYLDKNFDFDFNRTIDSIQTYYRLRPKKPILIRIDNNNFISRITKYLKNYIGNSKSFSIEEKKELYIEIDSIELILLNVWNSLSILVTSVLSEIERLFNRDFKVTINTFIKIFDYMLFFLYTKSFILRWGNIDLHIVSFTNEKYRDLKVINFSNKFNSINTQFETWDHPNKFIRYMLRNEYQDYNDWRRYYLNPKEPFNYHYFSYKSKDIYYFERRQPSEFITDHDWLYYCIPQLIHSHIQDLLNKNTSIREYQCKLGVSIKDYNYTSPS